MYRFCRTAAVATIAVLLGLGAAVPAAAGGPADRPFAGSMHGPGSVIPDATCPIGLRTVSTGTGNVTHLGFTSVEASHCTPNPPFGPEVGPIVGGRITFTAANGDALEGTYTWTAELLEFVEGAPVHAVLDITVAGGAGRFGDATGHVRMQVDAVLHIGAPMAGVYDLAGRIGY